MVAISYQYSQWHSPSFIPSFISRVSLTFSAVSSQKVLGEFFLHCLLFEDFEIKRVHRSAGLNLW